MVKLNPIDCQFGRDRCRKEEQLEDLPDCYEKMIALAKETCKAWDGLFESLKVTS